MSTPDIAILALVAASTLYGLSRGGVKEIFSILAILGGVAGGIYLHGPVGKALGGSGMAYVAGFLVIFVVIAFLINRTGNAIRTSLKLVFLGGIDRLVGAGVGFLRGIIVVCLILGLASMYVDRSKTWVEDSKLSLPALKAVEILSPMFPEELRDQFEGRYGEVRDYWEKAKKSGKRVQEGLERAEELKKSMTGD